MFAVATLVMCGDNYVPGALVLAASCRIHNPQSHIHLVCLITADVSTQARHRLRQQFDVVQQVEYIEAKVSNQFTKKVSDKYNSWWQKSFTKWQSLSLVAYRRVLFLDADCLVVGDITRELCDPQFAHKPAGVYVNYWSDTFLQQTNQLQTHKEPLHDYLSASHPSQQIITRTALRQALFAKDKKPTYVPAGSSICFQPFINGAEVFKLYLQQQLRKYPKGLGNPMCRGSGPDDQAIVHFLLDYHPFHATEDWQALDHRWCCLPWKHAEALPNEVVRHYFNVNKPWSMPRDTFSDLQDWWQVYDQLPGRTIGRMHHFIDKFLPLWARPLPQEHWPAFVEAWKKLPQGDDEVALQTLRQWRAEIHIPETYHSSTRSLARVQTINSLLPKKVGTSKDVFLDFGCGTGHITDALQQHYHKSKVHGCDVEPRAELSTRKWTYHCVNETGNLPFENASLTVIIALMSLHHVHDVDHVLQEFHRCLKPQGNLILLEHDVQNKEFSQALDIMHGMYAQVWSNKGEMQDFVAEFYARYYSQKEWFSLLQRHGFKILHKGVPEGPHQRFWCRCTSTPTA